MFKSSFLGSTALALGLILASAPAFALVTTESLVADYRAQGYGYIEVTQGLTQSKVEAIKDGVKVEAIVDNATGEILKSETSTASTREKALVGVETRVRDRDFLDHHSDDSEDDSTDDSEDSHHSGDESGDDGEHDGGGDHDSGGDHGGEHDSGDHGGDHD